MIQIIITLLGIYNIYMVSYKICYQNAYKVTCKICFWSQEDIRKAYIWKTCRHNIVYTRSPSGYHENTYTYRPTHITEHSELENM